MLKLLKNISIYTFGNILNKGVMFLLLPLYTRVLAPADYGKLELVYLVGSILSIVFGFYIERGYGRIYFESKEIQFRKKLFATGQLFYLFFSVLFAGLIILNADKIAAEIFKFEDGGFYLKLIIVATAFEVLKHIPLSNLRIRHLAKIYVTFNLVGLIIVTSLTIYFVAVLKLGVAGVLYAKIIGHFIILIVLHYNTRTEYSFGFSFPQLYAMLGFSIFLIPSGLSALVLSMSNRFFLQEYQSLEEVGLYSLGAKLAGIIPFLITGPVKQAFIPYIYELIDSPEKCKKMIVSFSSFFFASLSVFALAISLYSRELILIMSDISYAGSHNIVFVLSVSYLLQGLSAMVVIGINITRKTWIIGAIWPVSALVNLLLNIWLIPEYGRMGAAYATFLSVVVINILYFYALSKVYPIKFEYFSLVKVFLVMIFINYIGNMITLPIWSSLLVKTVLLTIFVVLIFYFGAIKKSELNSALLKLKNGRIKSSKKSEPKI
jgi:O-antigen/teichoic acid export membrane protein